MVDKRLLSSLFFLPLALTFAGSGQNSSVELTLDKAIEQALRGNLQLKAQYFQYLGAKNDFYAQLAKRFGEFRLFWQYNQYKFARVVAPIQPPLTPSSLDDQVRVYGLTYGVRLFDGCKQFFLIRAKWDTAKLERVNWENLSKAVKRDVADLYFQALEIRARLNALKERKKEVESLYRIVKEAYRIGKKPLLDLLNVEAELKRVEAAISETEAAYQAVKNRLKVLLNLDRPLELTDVELKPHRVDGEKLFPYLLSGNPDLRAVSVKKRIVEDYRKVALANFAPTVDFTYSTVRYVYAGQKESDWSYTIKATFPIFDFGQRFFTYKKATYEKRKVDKLHALVEKKAVETFRSLVKQLNSQVEVIEANRKRLAFAKEAYKLEKQKYMLGKSDIYNLLKAEALYYTALGDYKASVYRWGELKAKLDYLLGK